MGDNVEKCVLNGKIMRTIGLGHAIDNFNIVAAEGNGIQQGK